MTRVLLPVLGLILLGIVAGFVVGVVVGVIVSPLTVTNADIANLRPAEKEDYVLMVSAAYALDHNLPDAQQRLARVDRDAASGGASRAKASSHRGQGPAEDIDAPQRGQVGLKLIADFRGTPVTHSPSTANSAAGNWSICSVSSQSTVEGYKPIMRDWR